MTTPLTTSEKQTLKQLLEHPVMCKALSEVLDEQFAEQRGATTLEACAMAYNHNEGAFGVLNRLHRRAELKESFGAPSTSKRFKPTPD